MADLIAILQAVAGNVETAVEPVGIDFDGTNDYLSRSSDLTGNTDSKTFTFSVWFYPKKGISNTQHFAWSSGGYTFHVTDVNNGGQIHIDAIGNDQAWPPALYANVNVGGGSGSFLSTDTWNHLLISINLTSTSTRHIFINDTDVTSNTDFFDGSGWYRNAEIDFTKSAHYIGSSGTSGKMHGRLAGVYLDYTYRDLSVEANRRLFIDDDGLYVKPPTSGIISVPLDDPDDPGRNDGTGGDFTLNGVVAQSGRGPNQYNAAASTFDGSADYLSKSNLLQGRDGRYCTCSFFLNPNTQTTVTDYGSSFSVQHDFNKKINIRYSPNNDVLDSVVTSNAFPYNKWIHVCFSFDSQDAQNTFQLFVDGVQQTVSGNFTNRTSNTFGFDTFNVAKYAAANNKDISDFWFTLGTAIDLSSENPFYDTETDKPKYLGASGELPTGSSPLIYTPLRANDAGNNLGTGGDFTVNSGPYTGARGPSEFWASAIKTTNNSHYVNSSLSSQSTFTIATAIDLSDGGNAPIHITGESAFYFDGSSSLIRFFNGNATVVQFSNSTDNTGGWKTVLLSVNLSTNTAYCYLDGSVLPITTNNMSSYSTADFDNLRLSYEANSKVGAFYMSSTFVDLSQEANRLKFFDAFGYPLDWENEVENENIDSPIVLLKFDNPSSFGSNSGTLSNFTVTGTVSDAGYVKG